MGISPGISSYTILLLIIDWFEFIQSGSARAINQGQKLSKFFFNQVVEAYISNGVYWEIILSV